MKINFASFRKIIKWNAQIAPADQELTNPSSDSERVNDTSVEFTDKKDTYRRLQDTLSKDYPNRHMNLDRRAVRSERRIDIGSHYKGPARRYTIDRRLNLKDRREKD